MAYGYYLQAEYESGFVLTEDELDHSPYDVGRNVFHAILNNRPEDFGHGQMVRFSLLPFEHNAKRYDIDWTQLKNVKNPRPIYYRQMSMTRNLSTGEDTGPLCESHHFGYQYNDADGRNVQVVEDVV